MAYLQVNLQLKYTCSRKIVGPIQLNINAINCLCQNLWVSMKDPWALEQDLTRSNYSFIVWGTAIFSLKVRMKTSRKPVIGKRWWEDYDLTLKHFSYLQIAVCRDISSQAFKISNNRDLITFSGLCRIIWEDINGINSIKEIMCYLPSLRQTHWKT